MARAQHRLLAARRRCRAAPTARTICADRRRRSAAAVVCILLLPCAGDAMNLKNITVEQLMSTALVTARADETIDDIDFEMQMAAIRHIPVVDDHNHVVGVVSQRDLLRALAGPGTRKPAPIRSIMTTRVLAVQADDQASDAIEVLLDNKIGCVPVLGDDGQLVGIVTETDFLRLASDVLHGRPAEMRPRAS
jgi:CBS domain-containing protein